ncbi:alpha/beta hydrolase family protein [Microbacterium sp. YY-01]|uniref:alpha/beta hydrolase family protein n=1 Tax=Microbacterium sp. YY-01 TaxID=3421634 RepID=UPI003D17CBCC
MQQKPYGTWSSPFSASDLAAGGSRIDGARFVGDEVWWAESIPHEGGRNAVRRARNDGAVEDILRAPWNARSRVHEYGGASWTTTADGTLLFVEASDQRVYAQHPEADPVALTSAGARYGGLTVQQGRLFAVREDLRSEPHERSIVEIPLDASAATSDDTLTTWVRTAGFVAHPALSPDATRLAWVQWEPTSMPWQHATIVIGNNQGAYSTSLPTQAGLQPEWVSNHELLYIDDPNGRWNLYRATIRDGDDGIEVINHTRPVAPAQADTGGGLWVLGQRWYRPLDDGRIIAVRTQGTDTLAVITPTASQPDNENTAAEPSTVEVLTVPLSADISIADAAGSRVLVTGSGATVSAGLWCIDVGEETFVALRGGDRVDSAWMPRATPVVYPGPHGPVHAFNYPPTNPEATAPDDELPPYVVLVHGGPTAHVAGAASLAIAYYTSRGIGVLDVNYSGSTGYGRKYRERLSGQWGVADVDDVLAAAEGLAASGAADPRRIAIRGGSAGGWTVLCSLVRGGVFAAGISRYGVADLRSLAADTHDFEKHYTDGLVGPLPEAEHIYIERSPLTHADRITVPVLLLQGEDDAVVPPSQSEAIRDALAARNIPHEMIVFPHEGHGFRRAETIIAATEAEITFLGGVFGFTPELE